MVSFSPRGKHCLGYQTENHHRTTRVMAGALSQMLIFQNTRGVRDAPPTANYCLACAENSSSIVPAEHSRVREKPSSPKNKSYFRNPLFCRKQNVSSSRFLHTTVGGRKKVSTRRIRYACYGCGLRNFTTAQLKTLSVRDTNAIQTLFVLMCTTVSSNASARVSAR
jgi:hypothetical protein